MKTENDQLTVLRRMRKEGRLTAEEFKDLTRGSRDDQPALTEPEDESNDVAEFDDGRGQGSPTPEATDRRSEPFLTLSLRENLSVNYVGTLSLGSIVLVALAFLSVISWLFCALALLVLGTTLFQGMRSATLAGAIVLAATLIAGVVLSGNDSSRAEPATGSITAPEPIQPIPGSLGIYMDQITESWNTVDGPPQIVRGLTRQNEIGTYDTFIYRFGEWGRVAGAYDPDTDAVYALLVTGGLYAEDTDQLYLHLCFVVAPYSPDCIASYFEDGLSGGTTEDFVDQQHQSEWVLDDHTWRLEIDQNVLTIRVYGADAA